MDDFNEWVQVFFANNELSEDNTTERVLEIVDDALCHGFEFKVENHKLYTRIID